MVFIAGKTLWSMPERFKVVCIPCKADKCSDSFSDWGYLKLKKIAAGGNYWWFRMVISYHQERSHVSKNGGCPSSLYSPFCILSFPSVFLSTSLTPSVSSSLLSLPLYFSSTFPSSFSGPTPWSQLSSLGRTQLTQCGFDAFEVKK